MVQKLDQLLFEAERYQHSHLGSFHVPIVFFLDPLWLCAYVKHNLSISLGLPVWGLEADLFVGMVPKVGFFFILFFLFFREISFLV